MQTLICININHHINYELFKIIAYFQTGVYKNRHFNFTLSLLYPFVGGADFTTNNSTKTAQNKHFPLIFHFHFEKRSNLTCSFEKSRKE